MREVLSWLHLIGITFWVGSVFVNILVLVPSLGVISPAEREKLTGAFLKRFAPLAWGAIALVVITGVIRTDSIIGFSTLVSLNTRYGNILLAKIILTLLLILNGAYMGSVLGPRIASFASPPGGAAPADSGEGAQAPGPPPELLRLQGRLNALNWVQVILAVAVLFLMGQI